MLDSYYTSANQSAINRAIDVGCNLSRQLTEYCNAIVCAHLIYV